jgi:formate dehydrogenase major subunit
MAMLQKLGWDKDLTPQERQVIEQIARVEAGGGGQSAPGGADGTSAGDEDTGEAATGSGAKEQQQGSKINWKTDLSGGIQRVAILRGCAPFGNGKARAYVWNYPDAVPIHREPLFTPRRDLLPDYQTYEDRRAYRLPVLYRSIQEENFADRFPLILTTGRLVEYEGGGDETRSNKWLAELQQEMFAEINPEDAAEAGIQDGAEIWVHSPQGSRIRVAAMVTRRVGPGTVFLPFHFGGQWQGEDLGARYPEGTVPYVLGESANTVGTYGYDIVTFMQESKGTLCRIEPA